MSGLRFGVVGLGVISRFYLAALERVPGVRLAAVCDRDAAVLEPFGGRVPAFADHREMLAAGGLDAVVVTVPNDLHLAVGRDALRAGLPVCVEKPLALRAAEGAELAALAAERRVPLFTAFHRRYNAAVRELCAALARHPSPVRSVTARYFELIEEHVGRDRWYLDPERCGGGCVADNGPNAYDLLRLLAGPMALLGAEVVRDGTGVDRSAVLELAGPDGVRGRIELDWSYPGERKDVTVELADGTVLRADLLAGHAGFKQSLWHEYEGIVGEFAGLLRGAGPADPDGPGGPSERGPDGVDALRVVEAAYRAEAAARTGVRG
ncbi:Gfo/Idh/MocA family oxidoreductase [Kitasatospora sp. NA04385]|uniref:Gfo/Idh/MocA family protein n=1 Tax=Kitasatospora sp. NA04385 TaxID=2742135 RepID=UPI0015920B5E|nr:Gfo/Idh/MocA family oxidoreductase [Kitasatospora sp. NA04385]QKW18765.1 Gfo/Idh/MocA family oxidoreductase [Kitasatospora sp. NA04385]